MPAPSHLVDSLGRCGVSFVVIAFYVLIAVATIVGVVGPATLVTWPNARSITLQPPCIDATTCNITQYVSITGLAPYNQLVAVMARVKLPTHGEGKTVTQAEYIGFDQTYTLLAVGRDASGSATVLSSRSHHTFLEFDLDPETSSSPAFVLAYYPQCVTAWQLPLSAGAIALSPHPLYPLCTLLLPQGDVSDV